MENLWKNIGNDILCCRGNRKVGPIAIVHLLLFGVLYFNPPGLRANEDFVVAGQSETITGTVTDPEGVPLPGVSIVEKGTTNGVATDFDGKFSMEVASESSVLIFTYIGMKTVEIPVDGQNSLNVQLEEDAQSLEEVVVVGYGTQKRKEVTTAVAKVNEDDFNQGVVSSPLDLIQGKIAGLNVTRANGNNPNTGTSIQLRGVTSLTGDRSPLIVIDGIPGGNLDLLQQNDIESFDVLKDGSAAAIYGTRGNNGVILITTKKGKKGIGTFEYSTFLSKDYVVSKPDFLTAEGYRGLIANGTIGESQDLGASTDIFDELTNTDNLSQYHNLAASGGGENNTYRASLYYRDLEGIAINNAREEFGMRTNFTQSALEDRLNFQASVAVNVNNADFSGQGDNGILNGGSNQFGIVTDWNPTAPIYAPFSNTEGEFFNQGRYGFYQPQNGYNPFSEYANRKYQRQQITFSTDAKVGYEFFDGFTFSVFGSYQRDTYNDRQYRSTEDWVQYNPGSEYRGTGYARKFNRLTYTKTFEPTMDYTREFDSSTLQILGGYSYQYSTLEQYSLDNSGFTTDAFEDWNFGAGNAITDTDLPRPNLHSFKEDNTLIAYFSRLNYSYLDRYFLQASVRYEGSSRFGANNKWGTFPAVSAGWSITDESFMQGLDAISNLKLRAGYGVTGNQGIPNYQSLVTLGTGGKYPIFLDDAAEATYYQTYGANKNPNPDLKWERKGELNVGLDFGLFQNKLSGAIDYYNRTTKDLLLSYTVPQPPFVQGSIYTNVGTIQNNGIELTLGYAAVSSEKFQWNVDFAGSYQKNEIATLSNEQFIVSELFGGNIGNPGNLGDAIRNTEGGPIGDFYGKRFAGFTVDGQWLFHKQDGSIGRVSDMVEEDKAIIGNGLPKYHASLSNTFAYANFDLTVFFRGKFDFDILNTVDLFYGNRSLLPANVLTSVLDEYSQINEAPQYSDYYLEKGDFVKLDNVTLGYNFNLPDSSPLSQFRIFASARNLATFTGYGGRDPEVQDTGLYPGIDDRNFYPRTTTVTAGVNLKF